MKTLILISVLFLSLSQVKILVKIVKIRRGLHWTDFNNRTPTRHT